MTDRDPFPLLTALAVAAGYCPTICEHGGQCSLKAGHDGEHVSKTFGGLVVCRWTTEADRCL